jgi:glycosyltransferase involved in cell wall biosynthesis
VRIALVNKYLFEHGGQEAVLLEEARLLESAGHDIALWGMLHPNNLPNLPYQATFAPWVDFSQPANGQLAGQPWVWGKLQLARQFIRNNKAAEGFQQFLTAFEPDVIHAHGIAHQLTPTILMEAANARIPVVQTLHDYQLICPSYTLLRGDGQVCHTVACQTAGQGFLPCVTHTCIKGSRPASVLNAVEMALNAKPFIHGVKHFIGPSQFLVQLMQQHGITHITHLPNCVSPLTYTPFNVPNLPERFVLYAGRLSHEKGLHTLLEASRLVPQLPLVVVGSGPLAETLKASGLPHVIWLGFQPRQQVMALLKQADAMVLPSEWYENAPMSVIEAHLMATPVIAADIGGLPEMITHGQTGWLFPSRDAHALAACLQTVYTQPARAKAYGQAAAQVAKQRYEPNQHVNALTVIYQQVSNCF